MNLAKLRRQRWVSLIALAFDFQLLASVATAQEAPGKTLANGSFEEAEQTGKPSSWIFITRPASLQTATLDDTEPLEGTRSALIDCSEGNNEFANLMQSFGAESLRGQRARFRAAVRTSDLEPATKVQLWFRVDRGREMVGFDNMQDRPIRTAEWQQYDIVLDVPDDATRINVGMFLIGKGKAWVDNASLEVVSDAIPTTSSVDTAAWTEAANAPQQPLFNHWLWLALIGCVLFVVSETPANPTSERSATSAQPAAPTARTFLHGFALRFSLLYWLAYSLPQPFTALTPGFLQPLLEIYGSTKDSVIRWTGARMLGIEAPMVAPNGSGDTTYAYVGLLVCFVLAITGAALWTLLARRPSEHKATHDLLRSYLRYVLAMTMVSYGLSKAGSVINQFPVPGDAQLERTYSASSPMGLLWTFMGASRAYTIFGGLGEILGGVLLLWRRTTTLGSLIVVAVMTNVVMLNFSYDVPVKQYSAHLLLMALFLLLPEARRLSDLLILNRRVAPADLRPAFTGVKAVWFRRVAKAALIIFIAVVPLSAHTWRELQHARSRQAKTERSDSLLMTRGFRWINEVPFNR